ncbi:MAG: DUF3086 domain-containing protein [Spirulinaceae cyanobacterium SM2_1_0]|nr:DUF3086 domain-containing protein [Spirulinaceae cyanobacterium SM2_1_0]
MNSDDAAVPNSERDRHNGDPEAMPPLPDLGDRDPEADPRPVLNLGTPTEAAAEPPSPPPPAEPPAPPVADPLADFEARKAGLQAEIATLTAQRDRLLADVSGDIPALLQRLVADGTQELEQRRQSLQATVEQLERRRDRVREEIRSSFAGQSQDIAIRVQGFKEYLVGSLQDLAAAAEQLQLPELEAPRPNRNVPRSPQVEETEAPTPRFAKQSFQEQRRQVISLLDQYRARPDYYGPPWQLRRTFEPVHAERVQDWFFKQGGRGALRSMGSRLQNILIASAAISILNALYGDRLRVLVLANTPERLGEWRRGLQDCLGISRGDFGPTRGVGLFESPDALVQKADRLLENKLLPLVAIDETEDNINLALLQFPLWLAFAPDPNQVSSYAY